MEVGAKKLVCDNPACRRKFTIRRPLPDQALKCKYCSGRLVLLASAPAPEVEKPAAPSVAVTSFEIDAAAESPEVAHPAAVAPALEESDHDSVTFTSLGADPTGGSLDVTNTIDTSASLPSTRPAVARSHPAADALGRYQKTSPLASGGMGEILQGVDPDIGRLVAIKVIRGCGNDRRLKRFIREARIAGQLEHPNIVPVYEIAKVEDGTTYFTMKLIRGRSIEDVLDLSRDAGEGPSEALRRRLLGDFTKICDAISYAHSRGVVHRDLKPANVMIGDHGEVLVVDWGIAKILGSSDDGALPGEDESADGDLASSDSDAEVLTMDGSILGTPRYLAPEQADPGSGPIDPRTDIYALGVILYEILTLTTPHLGMTKVELLGQILSGRIEAPSNRAPDAGIPTELDAVVLKALSLEPEDRYQDVRALKSDIEAFLEDRLVSVARYSTFDRAAKWVRRHRAVSAVAGVAALVLFVVTVGFIWRLDVRRRYAEDREAEALEAKEEAEVARVAETRSRLDAERAREEAESARGVAEGALEAAERARLAAERDRALAIEAGQAAEEARDRAESEAERSRRLVGRALEIKGLEALAERRFQAAAVLLAAALEIEDGPVRRGGALVALEESWRSRVLRPGGPIIDRMAWSADGRLASGDREGFVSVHGADGTLLTTLRGHRSVTGLAWTPTGLVSASAGRSGSVRVWTGPTFRLSRTLDRGTAVFDLTRSPGGRSLVSIGQRISLRDPDLNVIREFEGQSPGGARIAWSADGRRLASVTPSGVLSAWDVDSGRLLYRIEQSMKEPFSLQALAWSPDGRRLAASPYDEVISLYDGETGEVVARLAGHARHVQDVAWSADGTRLASASTDGTARLWSGTDGQPIAVLPHTSEVRRVAFRPASRTLATGSVDGQIRIWDGEEGRLELVLEGHEASVYEIAWAPDGRSLASNSTEGELILWQDDRSGGRRVFREPSGDLWPVAWPDGRDWIATGAESGTIRIWETRTGAVRRTLEGDTGRFGLLATSPDGRYLASAVAFTSSTVRLWETDGWTAMPSLELPAPVRAFEWAPDGRRLVCVHMQAPDAFVWDVPRGEVVSRIETGSSPTVGVGWSPDGKRLAVASEDGRVRLWDGSSVVEARVGPLRTQPHLSWAHDSSRLAVLGSEGRVVLVGVEEADRPTPLAAQDPRAPARIVAWSPTERVLAGTSRSGDFQIWDVERNEARVRLPLALALLAWSPSGEFLAASAAEGGDVHLFDAATGDPLAVWMGHDGQIAGLAWSADGDRLATSSWDRTVRLWSAERVRTPAAELLGMASRRTGLAPAGLAVVTAPVAGRPVSVEACGKALEKKPGDRDLLVHRADLRLRAGDAAGAAEDLARVLEADPNDLEAVTRRAWLRSLAGDPSGALDDCERVLAGDPDAVEALRIRGNLRLAEGDLGAAGADFEAAGWGAGLVEVARRTIANRRGRRDRGQLISRTLDLLEAAVEAGYRDFATLESDRALRGLLGREARYRRLLDGS